MFSTGSVHSEGSISISCYDDSIDTTWEFAAMTKKTVMSFFNFIKLN